MPTPVSVPVLWLGTAERISALVETNHPSVWIMGDTADDDRRHGMGIVIVEYAGMIDKAQWLAPPPCKWNYSRFGKQSAASVPHETSKCSSPRTMLLWRA